MFFESENDFVLKNLDLFAQVTSYKSVIGRCEKKYKKMSYKSVISRFEKNFF